MKKLIIIASLVAVFSCFTSVQAATGGTITFYGQITSASCDVIVDGQSNDSTVQLPSNNTNRANGRAVFKMSLNNCLGPKQTTSTSFEANSASELIKIRSSETRRGEQLAYNTLNSTDRTDIAYVAEYSEGSANNVIYSVNYK